MPSGRKLQKENDAWVLAKMTKLAKSIWDRRCGNLEKAANQEKARQKKVKAKEAEMKRLRKVLHPDEESGSEESMITDEEIEFSCAPS